MSGIYLLAALSSVLWGSWFAVYNHGHITPVGSYFAWWYDDIPVALLALSVAGPAFAVATGLSRTEGARTAIRATLVIALFALLPYACTSGGGL
jgi:hypothetical protein